MDPHIGLALVLLWTKRTDWDISRHLASTKERPRIRQVNFPTWSWTSVTGEIFNDAYIEVSPYLERISKLITVSQIKAMFISAFRFVEEVNQYLYMNSCNNKV